MRAATLKVAISMLALMGSSPVLAHGSGGAPQTITAVTVEGDKFYVASPIPYSNPDGCGNTTSMAFDSATLAKPDWMLSTILTAWTTGKKVAFYFQGCVVPAGGGASVPFATTLYVVP